MAFYFTQSRGGMSTFRFEELLQAAYRIGKAGVASTDSNGGLRTYLGSYREPAGKVGRGLRCRLIVSDSSSLTLELLLLHWPDDAGHWSSAKPSREFR